MRPPFTPLPTRQREGEGEREVLMRQMSLARLAAGCLLGLLLLLLCLKLDGVMDSWVWCAGRLTNYPYSSPNRLLCPTPNPNANPNPPLPACYQ